MNAAFPKYMSAGAKDFISRLLMLNPLERLGVYVGRSANIRAHPWLASVDWRRLRKSTLPAPFIPKVRTLNPRFPKP